MAEPESVAAHAKLNLALDVVGRRPDGYHDLVSIMVEVGLADTLRFTPRPDNPTPPFSCRVANWTDAALGVPATPPPPDDDNLALRAIAALHRHMDGHGRATDIEILKMIPVGAGLGGGSADAAAALRWANRAWGANLDHDALARIALELGADVPFFLRGGWALAEGLGEKLTPLPPPPGPGWRFLIFAPPWAIGTAAAYRALGFPPAGSVAGGGDNDGGGAARRRIEPLLRALADGDRGAFCVASFNRFEDALAELAPRHAAFRRTLFSLGGRPARLTGSGAALWCLDDSPADMAAATAAHWRERLAAAGWPGVRVWSVGAIVN